MKFKLLAIACLASLSACQPGATSTPDVSAEPVTGAPAAIETACPPTVNGYRFLPASLDVPVPYHLRTDRLYTNKNGQPRRRVALEFLKGSADSVLELIDQSVRDAGYRARGRNTETEGSTTVAYIRKGGPNLYVTAKMDVGDRPNNPAAKGVLIYDYPLGPVPKTADGN